MLSSTLRGLSLGAAAMYFLDPRSGGRRRAFLREKVVRLRHEADAFVDRASRDLKNRAQGALCETRRHVRDACGVDDDLLARRVSSKMGRHVSHPRALDIRVAEGVVSLEGSILRSEVAPLLAAVKRVPGVKSVRHSLDIHASAGRIPELQGGTGGRPRDRRRVAPGAQLLAAVAGMFLTTFALKRFGVVLGAAALSAGAVAASRLTRGGARAPSGSGAALPGDAVGRGREGNEDVASARSETESRAWPTEVPDEAESGVFGEHLGLRSRHGEVPPM